MDCPMRVGSGGYMYNCIECNCAWWNSTREQCSVKTFLLKDVPLTEEEQKKNTEDFVCTCIHDLVFQQHPATWEDKIRRKDNE